MFEALRFEGAAMTGRMIGMRIVLAVAFVLVLCAATRAVAAPIELDNDVTVGWGNDRCDPANGLFTCPALESNQSEVQPIGPDNPALTDVITVGALRLFQPGELPGLHITIDSYDPTQVDRFQLTLHVGDFSQLVPDSHGNPSYAEISSVSTGFQDLLDPGPTEVSFDDFQGLGGFSGPVVLFLSGLIHGNPGFTACDPNVHPDLGCDALAPNATSAVITFSGGTALAPAAPVETPEPATLALVCSGLAGAGMRARRRRQSTNA
jgi:hypothetical protein